MPRRWIYSSVPMVANKSSGYAGGLGNLAEASANVSASTFVDDESSEGVAPDNMGTLVLFNSTLSEKHAADVGGAIHGWSDTTTIINCTIADNSASEGGGIWNRARSTLHVKNTIVAHNRAAIGPDIGGTVDSQGHNLIGDSSDSDGWVESDLLDVDPRLRPLRDNGGPTATYSLLVDSPAIDAGTNVTLVSSDQRGVSRPQDANGDSVAIVDIGAVERYYGETHGIVFRDDDSNGICQVRQHGVPETGVYLVINVFCLVQHSAVVLEPLGCIRCDI